MADAEMLEDIHDYDAAVQALEDGEELVPSEVVYALLEGANPIRVWREYRGLTQGVLGAMACISAAYLSQLETGKRIGTAEVLKTIASILDINVEDLVQ
jgi:predicted transcriptional regulator